MRTHGWLIHLGGVTAIGVAYVAAADPTLQGALWIAIAWLPVVAIVAGILLHRPAAAGPWWLMAGGLGAAGVAWVLTPASQDLTGTGLGGTAGDLLHLTGTVLIGAAALWFVRRQTPADDRDSVIDGVIVAVAVATVMWAAAIDPTALALDTTASGRAVFLLAPVLPAGIVAVCVRLLFSPGGRLASARLLSGAWLFATLGSIGWILLLQAGTFTPGGWPDVLWAVALACAGASALHPSMDALSSPTRAPHRAESTVRLVVLGIALLATPAAVLTTADGAGLRTLVPVTGAALVAVLVLVRLAHLVRDREAAHRELQTIAARQDVVARVGQAALGDHPVPALYAETEVQVAGVLDDVAVRIRPVDGDAHGADPTLLTLPIASPDRTWARLEVTAAPGRVLDPDERAFLTSVAAVLSGMVSRRQAEETLRRRALHDALTGLPNRVLVLEHLTAAVAQRGRGPVGVLFVDLDGFKPVNDAHGHAAGDALLTTIASRLPEVVRAGDTVGRFAGDEFVVVAPGCDTEGLAELAGRLLAAVVEPVELGRAVVSVGASIGGTLAAEDERDPHEILRRADAAMYEAKEGGGGTVLAPRAGATPVATAYPVPDAG